MFNLKKLPFFSRAFTLYILFAVPALIAAPSKEVTDRLIAELQDIRKNLTQEAIEIFQDDNRHLELETLPPACFLNGIMLPQAQNAITPLIVLTKGIQAIIWRLNEAEKPSQSYYIMHMV